MKMTEKEILIHINEDAAIALVEDRQLREIYLPRPDHQQLLGNIYLGEVENVLPGMQAAFVDIGLEKNSFLYVEDALPPRRMESSSAAEGEAGQRSIKDLVRKGQQVMVQVFKEPSGTKGARVTMQPSLPGRYLVLLPTADYIAVSRRIANEQERERLRQLLRRELPERMGAIVRTVAENADQELLAADLKLLLKEWRRIQGRAVKASPPTLLHRDYDLLIRLIRDTNPADIDRILVGDAETFDKLSDIIAATAPALTPLLTLRESRNLFLDYDIYSQMERALRRKVWLKSGG
jgi:ribonuclease G